MVVVTVKIEPVAPPMEGSKKVVGFLLYYFGINYL